MAIRGKRVSEITRPDIFELVTQQASEDTFIEFHRMILDPRGKLDRDRADAIADFVAFANAQGGHVIIGIDTDSQQRASAFSPMAGDQAKRLADALRDLVLAHTRPVVAAEVIPFSLSDDGAEWLVVAAVVDGASKPYMSTFQGRTQFVVRVANRKREMTYEEIKERFLESPQNLLLATFLDEIQSVRSAVEGLSRKIGG